jgi:hypothetical protein
MADTTKTITSLPSASTPAAADIALILVNGIAHQTTLNALLSAFSVATTSAKGLMSAADKAALDAIIVQLATMKFLQGATIASASTVTLPSVEGAYTVITFTGTTPITTINGLVAGRIYAFSYPSGAGLTILGTAYAAGDVNIFLNT